MQPIKRLPLGKVGVGHLGFYLFERSKAPDGQCLSEQERFLRTDICTVTFVSSKSRQASAGGAVKVLTYFEKVCRSASVHNKKRYPEGGLSSYIEEKNFQTTTI